MEIFVLDRLDFILSIEVDPMMSQIFPEFFLRPIVHGTQPRLWRVINYIPVSKIQFRQCVECPADGQFTLCHGSKVARGENWW
jgi:hypothetical protein